MHNKGSSMYIMRDVYVHNKDSSICTHCVLVYVHNKGSCM